MDEVQLSRARELLRSATRVAVLTGAGISTDSGIPDFRGPNGVWTRDPEAEKLSTIQVYVRDGQVRREAWQRRIRMAPWDRRPNPGHEALVTLERSGRLRALITQNVDGLHRVAGTDPDLLIEVHGNVREVHCIACGVRAPIGEAVARVEAGEADPPCVDCGGILKPAVVFFGEGLDPVDLDRAFTAAESCEVFLVVGSSLTVSPICDTAAAAVRTGADLVICNAEPTPYDRLASAVVAGSISDVLPRMVSE